MNQRDLRRKEPRNYFADPISMALMNEGQERVGMLYVLLFEISTCSCESISIGKVLCLHDGSLVGTALDLPWNVAS